MFVFVLLVAAALAATGLYLHENPGGAHDISDPVVGAHSGVSDWIPTAIVAGGFAVLTLLCVVYGSMRIGILRRANRRLVAQLESASAAAAEATDARREPAAVERDARPAAGLVEPEPHRVGPRLPAGDVADTRLSDRELAERELSDRELVGRRGEALPVGDGRTRAWPRADGTVEPVAETLPPYPLPAREEGTLR